MLVQNDFEISSQLWYKIGGKVKYFLDCKTKDDVIEAFDFVQKNNITKIFVCGLGSNLIFTDNYFDGAVIRISRDGNASDIHFDDKGSVEAFAGELLDDVIKYSLDHNLMGLEWAGGLPGTVGAAVRGNVGAFGGEIKDSLVHADVIDFSGGKPEYKTLSNDELQFVYRGSLIKSNKKMIVVSAQFALKKAQEEISVAKEVYLKNIQFRKDRHPLEYPNCGSVFKNIREQEKIEKVLSIYPELRQSVETKWHHKLAVASVIEKLGLKGYRVGDAQVSEKHALFIVNLGHAKASDVLQIIDHIQQTFQDKFGFKLEVEVEIVN